MEEKSLIKGTFPESYGWILGLGTVGILSFFISLFVYMDYPYSGNTITCPIFMVLGVVLVVLAIVFYLKFTQCSLTVTDKRVYGMAEFRRRVDLPIDKISSVGMGPFQSIRIATSSGIVFFSFCTNRDRVFEVISELLIVRQQKTTNAMASVGVASEADELKKYKDLLDGGVISQEEFDAKKKQLLGI